MTPTVLRARMSPSRASRSVKFSPSSSRNKASTPMVRPATPRGRGVGSTVPEQQLYILVECTHGAVELINRDSRHEVAPQALERRPQERVDQGEGAGLLLRVASRAARDGHDRQHLGSVI